MHLRECTLLLFWFTLSVLLPGCADFFQMLQIKFTHEVPSDLQTCQARELEEFTMNKKLEARLEKCTETNKKLHEDVQKLQATRDREKFECNAKISKIGKDKTELQQEVKRLNLLLGQPSKSGASGVSAKVFLDDTLPHIPSQSEDSESFFDNQTAYAFSKLEHVKQKAVQFKKENEKLKTEADKLKRENEKLKAKIRQSESDQRELQNKIDLLMKEIKRLNALGQ